MRSKFNILREQEISDSFSIYHLENQSFETSMPMRLRYNRIIFIQKGSGSLLIDDQLFGLTGNKIFLVAKGQVLHFQRDSIIGGYQLCFDDFFWEKAPASASNCKSVLFDNAAVNQMLPLLEIDFKEIEPIFQILEQEFQKTNYINKQDVLAAYVKIMMIKIANVNAALVDEYDSYEYQLYRKFYDLISKEFMLSHEVDHYAGQLKLSSRKLTLLCKRYSGKGAKELINLRLMTEAKRFLQFSTIPVKEIAYELKFLSAEQFSHFFKKETSLSPRLYRSNLVNIGM